MGFFIPLWGNNSENCGRSGHYSTEMIKGLFAGIVVTVAMATVYTAVSYAGTCSSLTGFAGMVQKVGLVAAGPCTATGNGKSCSNSACTTAAKKPGKCKNISPTGPANCACIETTISSGLQ